MCSIFMVESTYSSLPLAGRASVRSQFLRPGRLNEIAGITVEIVSAIIAAGQDDKIVVCEGLREASRSGGAKRGRAGVRVSLVV